MKVIYGINKIREFRKPVVALGVFDGLHIGHRRILKEVVIISKRINGTSVVVTFYPHPQKKESIYSQEHRLRLLGELGIKVCIVIRFNKQFSQILAGDFIKDVLVKKIRANYICVGKNFRFGKGARGDFRILDKLSRVYNFKLKVFDVLKINQQVISSTYIRRLITKGNLLLAQRFLCHPVSILGEVIKGISLAKKLGFPTANIDPHHEVLPPSGVYAVKIKFNNMQFKGVCFIGSRSILPNLKKSLIVEVHIFGFNKSIYGKDIEVEFISKIRDAKRFNSQESLASQVKDDITRAKKRLAFSLH